MLIQKGPVTGARVSNCRPTVCLPMVLELLTETMVKKLHDQLKEMKCCRTKREVAESGHEVEHTKEFCG